MSKYYLAYGSNLNKEQMRHRCPGAEPVGTAMIPNCRLVFRRGFLNIEPAEDSSVPVGVWRISKANEAALDRYEGYPTFYYKKQVRVMIDGGGPVTGTVYIMQSGHPRQMPSDFYWQTVIQGYNDFAIGDRCGLQEAFERARWP